MAAATVNWFTSEIQQMMFGFGDVRRPLHETAVLVEEIVHQQMTQVIYQAMEVAQMRGRTTIGAEDVVFLLRKDPVKLARLVRYMDARDKRAAVIRGSCVEEEDGAADLAEKQQPKKRKKVIVDFLATIDQTGELLASLDDDKVDEVKHERLLRAEMQARGMDPRQYMEFCLARQTNFSRRYKSQRFRDWLLANVHFDMKPNMPALEIISYLAFETIAQVVDLALIVKQTRLQGREARPDKQLPSSTFRCQDACLMPSRATPHPGAAQTGTPTPEAATVPGSSGTAAGSATTTSSTPASSASASSSTSSTNPAAAKPSKGKKRKKICQCGSNFCLETSTASVRSGSSSWPDALLLQAILPSDVQEAMRRFQANIGPLTSIVSVHHAYPVKKRLLCA